jgi:hypothetical protein
MRSTQDPTYRKRAVQDFRISREAVCELVRSNLTHSFSFTIFARGCSTSRNQ